MFTVDLILSNPPYTHNMDIKYIKTLFDISKRWVIVHPSTYILDLKHKHKMYLEFRDKIQHHIRRATFINGNPVFNITLFVPIVMIDIDKDFDGECECDYFGDKWKEYNVYDITKFGSDWHTIVKPFKEKMETYIKEEKI